MVSPKFYALLLVPWWSSLPLFHCPHVFADETFEMTWFIPGLPCAMCHCSSIILELPAVVQLIIESIQFADLVSSEQIFQIFPILFYTGSKFTRVGTYSNLL